jgi:hypothetical protein
MRKMGAGHNGGRYGKGLAFHLSRMTGGTYVIEDRQIKKI